VDNQQHDYEMEKIDAIRHLSKSMNWGPKQNPAKPSGVQTHDDQACGAKRG
jgi:hypothetical protein